MNRQQRRLLARQKEVEAKYIKELTDRQNRVDDRQVEIELVCIGLALNELYGWQGNGISHVLHEYNRQVLRLLHGETYEDLVADLKERTGVEISFKVGDGE